MKENFFQQASQLKYGEVTSGAVSLAVREANELNHGEMFDSLVSRQDTWDAYDSLPLLSKDIEHILVPFSYDQHHETLFKNENLEEGITSFINDWFLEKKYFLSCDRYFFFALKLENFSYDYVDYGVESGGFNSHFILFDDRKDRWVTFYSRFPFVSISWRNSTPYPDVSGASIECWAEFFKKNSSQAFQMQSDEFVNFVNKTYIPRIPNFDFVRR